ncbi:hypothetical protein IGI04_007869 [Brassica rapa subsp. trilocularis]|uniref:Uncharacterized protein n=1 Tax=Brassica rapa subsp. trilocularis TaxID=1813537 RepID=A0ABQ7NNA4_BRACM|nr:hypothetical protein IGI04_007869 [Brassica rapa subsp. trilocularis]
MLGLHRQGVLSLQPFHASWIGTKFLAKELSQLANGLSASSCRELNTLRNAQKMSHHPGSCSPANSNHHVANNRLFEAKLPGFLVFSAACAIDQEHNQIHQMHEKHENLSMYTLPRSEINKLNIYARTNGNYTRVRTSIQS